MTIQSRCVALFLKPLGATFLVLPSQSAEPLRSVDLAVSAIVYDPLTAKLYGAGTNNLLQIDPDSGTILRTWDMGSRIVRLELGAGGGIWAGISNAVRRFNLQTLALEDPIEVPGEINDLCPSQGEPYTLTFSTPRIVGRWESGWIIKNGVLLPDTVLANNVAINGNYFFKDGYRYPIGPNGIVNAGYVGSPAGGRMKPFGSYIYGQNGAVIHANTLASAEGSGRVGGPFAINPAENTVYYLSDSEAGWHLNRVEHPTARQTGHHLFTRLEPLGGNETVAAWSTNRVAFHSPTKLYLVDTTTLFGPSDVEVLQTTTSDVKVGQDYSITVTVTNKGPGAALHVTFQHSLSSGILKGESPPFYLFAPSIQTLEPGQSATLELGILATDAGVATNTIIVSASNDSNPTNNSSSALVPIARPTGTVVQLPFAVSDLAYDPLHTRLFFTSNNKLWMYDQDVGQLLPVAHNYSFQNVTVPEGGGTVWALYPGGWFIRFDSATFAETQLIVPRSPVHDVALPPAGSGLYAISEGRGTYVANGVRNLPNSIPEQGNVAFTLDGTQLYFVDASDCTFSVFRLDPAQGMILERRGTNVACGEFTVSNNQLYFKHGPVYDATTGNLATNSLSVTPPVFVVRRGDTYLDLLNRTNGIWTVRRLSASTHAPVITVPLAATISTPLDMVGMDANTVAIRTTSGPLMLVDLTDSDEFRAQLSFAGNQLLLSFYSVTGATYRIERRESITAGSWTVVRDNIAGTGGRIDETIPPNGSSASFYRVVRLGGG